MSELDSMFADAEKELKQIIPKFVLAVDSVVAGSADKIIMQLVAFHADPALFYTAVWYAGQRGVPIEIVPKESLQEKLKESIRVISYRLKGGEKDGKKTNP